MMQAGNLIIGSLMYSLSITAFAAGATYGPTSQTYEPSAASMALDAVVIRPLGLAATIIGSVVYVVSLPFSALGGNSAQARDKLVGEPARFTFKRPLGKTD